jgi:hypothetical protein
MNVYESFNAKAKAKAKTQARAFCLMHTVESGFGVQLNGSNRHYQAIDNHTNFNIHIAIGTFAQCVNAVRLCSCIAPHISISALKKKQGCFATYRVRVFIILQDRLLLLCLRI